jgi:CHASE2 domain-containing sensor protein
MVIGAQVAGNVYNAFLDGRAALPLGEWFGFWLWPAALAAAIMLFFVVFFKDRVLPDGDASEEEVSRAAVVDAGP